MAAFRPNLPAREVDRRLRQSLEELRIAEKNAVLWFGEVMHRKLYRKLGHSSIHQYAAVALGFGKSKTAQFVRLSESLRTLPRLRNSVAKGELSWTKAREVAKVASPKTERKWIAQARRATSRELERTVTATRRRARVARGKVGDQEMLAVVGNVCVKTDGVEVPVDVAAEVPVDVSVRFTPEQYARYEALVEKLRKQDRKESREELLLAGLEELCANREFPRIWTPPVKWKMRWVETAVVYTARLWSRRLLAKMEQARGQPIVESDPGDHVETRLDPAPVRPVVIFLF